MAATKKAVADATTAVLQPKNANPMTEPTVRVMIPELHDQSTEVAVDQTEVVTINGVTTRIERGKYVDVKVPVFLQLKQRYPNL